MGFEMDMRKRLNANIDIPSSSSGPNIIDELEVDLMKYTRNGSKVDKPLTELMMEACRDDSDYVDIIGCSKSGDTTESSRSSFGTSDSDVGNMGDEAISSLHGDVEPAVGYHGDMSRPRKKQQTPHWEAFIRPVMWRCKWVELQVKKLEAQARKYERQLAMYNQQKYVPFSQLNLNNKLLRRKKRRKTKTTTDLAAHMSSHNLFSCYENLKGINRAVGKAKRPVVGKAKGPAAADQKDKVVENVSPLMPNDFALIESPQYGTTHFPNIGGRPHVGSYSSSQCMTEPYADDAFMTRMASTSFAHEGQGGVLDVTNDFDAVRNWLMQDEPGGNSTALVEEPDLTYEDEQPPNTRLLAPARGRSMGRRNGAGRL